MSDQYTVLMGLALLVLLVGFAPQVRLFLSLVRSRHEPIQPAVTSAVFSKEPSKKQDFTMPRGRSQLRSPTLVDFDPSNSEHQAALYMMMAEARQHPTLRFHFDAGRFDNAYDACLFAMADYAVPAEAKRLAKLLANLKKHQASPKKKRPVKVNVRVKARVKESVNSDAKNSETLDTKKHTVNKRVGRKQNSRTDTVPNLKLC